MPSDPDLVPVSDPATGGTWWIDRTFLRSTWRCRWDDGCVGIDDVERPDAGLGCCSEGAQLLDEDEARRIDALGRTLDPNRFQHHVAVVDGGLVTRRDGRAHTRVVDGACVFLNRPGFAGGHGCALHLDAVAEIEDPTDGPAAALEAKPAVCWQLPMKIDRSADEPVLRAWRRSDWGPGGETMAWCCTEGPSPSGVDAHDGGVPVTISLRAELDALLGDDLAAEVVAACD